jgi:hypothetical protein
MALFNFGKKPQTDIKTTPQEIAQGILDSRPSGYAKAPDLKTFLLERMAIAKIAQKEELSPKYKMSSGLLEIVATSTELRVILRKIVKNDTLSYEDKQWIAKAIPETQKLIICLNDMAMIKHRLDPILGSGLIN